jgi:hypothetical protein
MSFIPSNRRSRTSPPKVRSRVWAVGSRAYVHSPANAAIVLTDEFDKVASGSLDDGAEVEVRAWRPRSVPGARYHVRSRDGAEGWLGVADLRSTRDSPSAAPVPAVAPPSEPETGFVSYSRRFGQR